jgi:hypothetical protein
MSKRITLIVIAAVFALAVSATAFAAKGGGGKAGNTGGGGGGGQIDPTIGISSQQPGSISFSVNTNGAISVNVTTFCYDSYAQLAYSADQPVVWSSTTLGFAGPFSPPSGLLCGAFVHAPGSTTRLGQISFVAE